MSLSTDISISIEYTLPIYAAAKEGAAPLFVSEFDCILEINADEYERGQWDWDVVGITFDGPKPITDNSNTDPYFWTVASRSFKAERNTLHDKIMDQIYAQEAA